MGFQNKRVVVRFIFCALLFGMLGEAQDAFSRERVKKPKGPSERSRAFFEVKYGLVGPGELEVEGDKDDLTSSYAVGASLDFPVYGKLNVGGEISVFNFKYDIPAGWGVDASRDVLTGFFITRYSFLEKENQFVLRAGLGIGVGYLQEPYQGEAETKYLLKTLTAEGGIMVSKKFGFGVELGLLWGKDAFGTEYEVSAGSFPIVRAMLISR